ncbi:MAG: four helix bundle protein [Saprospiraceae bacterium]
MAKFRFEDLEIWKEAIKLASIFFRIANDLDEKKLWRFSDQTRGAGMSIPNNISESTGTKYVNKERQLLRYAKRECFEGANILVILKNEGHITHLLKEETFERLHVLSKRIQAYSDSL